MWNSAGEQWDLITSSPNDSHLCNESAQSLNICKESELFNMHSYCLNDIYDNMTDFSRISFLLNMVLFPRMPPWLYFMNQNVKLWIEEQQLQHFSVFLSD